MSKRVFAVFGAIMLSFFLSFCAGLLDDELDDMPSGIWMSVPSSLDDGESGMSPMAAATNNTNEGPAYAHIKSYVRAAKILCNYGDQIVSALRANWAFMKLHKGTIVDIPSGGWVFMNDQTGGGFFLYYGTNLSSTNIYFDWEGTIGDYKGKLVLFLDGTNDTPIQVVAYYDQSLAEPQLEMYAKYDGNGVWKITNLHVLLIQISPDMVQVQAMAEYDRPYPMAWQLQGNGWSMGDGGAVAYATGISNIATTEYFGTNYIYSEYFDYMGYTIWKQGVADLYYTNGSGLYQTNVFDPSVSYTNEFKPVNVELMIFNISRLTSSKYPVLTLP